MPEVSDVTDSSVKLNWAIPESDGGSPIINYAVEYIKRGDKSWTSVRTADDSRELKVTDLMTNANYMYRVAATNKVLSRGLAASPSAVDPLRSQSIIIHRQELENHQIPRTTYWSRLLWLVILLRFSIHWRM